VLCSSIGLEAPGPRPQPEPVSGCHACTLGHEGLPLGVSSPSFEGLGSWPVPSAARSRTTQSRYQRSGAPAVSRAAVKRLQGVSRYLARQSEHCRACLEGKADGVPVEVALNLRELQQ
jgi:hypothetical protein